MQANLLRLGKVHLHIASASFRPIATVAAASGNRYDFPGVDHEGRQTCRL